MTVRISLFKKIIVIMVSIFIGYAVCTTFISITLSTASLEKAIIGTSTAAGYTIIGSISRSLQWGELENLPGLQELIDEVKEKIQVSTRWPSWISMTVMKRLRRYLSLQQRKRAGSRSGLA